MIKSINYLFHWRMQDNPSGEVWADGIRINGKPFKTLVFDADLTRMEFSTMLGTMKFVEPDVPFKKNTERLYGSLERYIRDHAKVPCSGRVPY